MNWFQQIIHNWKEYKRLKRNAKKANTKKDEVKKQDIERLMVEYNKIQFKESKLPRKERELVIETVHNMLKSGQIKMNYPEKAPLKKV